jgi:hypothetical protein
VYARRLWRPRTAATNWQQWRRRGWRLVDEGRSSPPARFPPDCLFWAGYEHTRTNRRGTRRRGAEGSETHRLERHKRRPEDVDGGAEGHSRPAGGHSHPPAGHLRPARRLSCRAERHSHPARRLASLAKRHKTPATGHSPPPLGVSVPTVRLSVPPGCVSARDGDVPLRSAWDGAPSTRQQALLQLLATSYRSGCRRRRRRHTTRHSATASHLRTGS